MKQISNFVVALLCAFVLALALYQPSSGADTRGNTPKREMVGFQATGELLLRKATAIVKIPGGESGQADLIGEDANYVDSYQEFEESNGMKDWTDGSGYGGFYNPDGVIVAINGTVTPPVSYIGATFNFLTFELVSQAPNGLKTFHLRWFVCEVIGSIEPPTDCPSGTHDDGTGNCVPDTDPPNCADGFYWNGTECVPIPTGTPEPTATATPTATPDPTPTAKPPIDIWPTPTPTNPSPTATPTPTPKPPVVETTTPTLVAGGVRVGPFYSSVAVNPHQSEISATVEAKDGVLAGQDVSFEITSDHAGQSIQPGVAECGDECGKDAPAASVTVKTDANGVARAVLTSGSNVGPVTVKVTANEQSSAQSFTVEKAQSQWTATPVDPDSDEKPIVRLSLKYAGLPVNGHPISWKINRIKLDDNEIVQVSAWNEHARFTGTSATGETISTTGASVNPGEAAAYAYFSDEVRKVDFSGDDSSIIVNDQSAVVGELSVEDDMTDNSSTLAVASARSVAPREQRHKQSIINKVLNSGTKELETQKGWKDRKRKGRGYNTNNVLGKTIEERALVTQGYSANQIRIPFGVQNDVSITFDVDSTLAANGKIASLKISARDTNGDLLQYSRDLETGQARMTVNGQLSAGGFDAPGSIKYFFRNFAPALGEAWIDDNYTVKGKIGQSKRVYVTVKNLGIGFYKGGEGLITAAVAARNGLIDAAYNPEEAWSEIKVSVDGIKNPAIRNKLIVEVLKSWGNEYDLMYSDAVTGNGEKFAAFAGQGGGQFGFDSLLGFGIGKAATLGKTALKGTALYTKAASAGVGVKYVSVGKIAIKATMTNTGRISRVIRPVVKPLAHVGKISWKYRETTAAFARKALSSSKARIACYVKGKGHVVLVRAEAGKGFLGFNKAGQKCYAARIFGDIDPKTKRFTARAIELIARACFVKGTPILMADGSHVAIEQIKIGDLVMSRDEATGQVSAQKVVQTFERQANATLVLRLKNGETIETTKEHPFYVESQGFTPAGEMGIGTSIVTRAGPSATLASSKVRNRTATVYNFEVENTHTYFVGQSDLWVHNFCGIEGLKWGWTSKKTWGHTFLRHGKKQSQSLIDRARTKGPQGRWLDDKAAAEYLEGEVKKLIDRGIHEGVHLIDIPEGLGEIITVGANNVPVRSAATKANIVFQDAKDIYDSTTGKGELLKSAHPFLVAE